LGYAYPKVGLVGKEKMLHIRFSSYGRRWTVKRAAAAAILLVAASCAEGPPHEYSGKLTPIAGTCDPPGRAILTRTDNQIQFVPRDGVVILPGTIGASGQIEAALALRGTDRAASKLQFIGQLRGPRVAGTYTTPRCQYSVDLSAVPQ
jgi:hypothetical protein